MDYNIEYDTVLGCFVLFFAGEMVCLGADTHSEAMIEATTIVEQWD